MRPEQTGENIRDTTEMTGIEIVNAYQRGEIPSAVVMERCLDLTERSHLADNPLIVHGKTILDETGKPVKVVDYIDHAGGHGRAIDTILGYVRLDPSSEVFPTASKIIAGMIDNYTNGEDAK